MKNFENLESKIGFSEIRLALLNLCVGTDTKKLVDEISFSTNYKYILLQLKQVNEMLYSLTCLKETETFPCISLPQESIKAIALKLEKDGSTLDINEFIILRKCLEDIQVVYNFLHSNTNIDVNKTYPVIKETLGGLQDTTTQIKLISRIFDTDDNIRDNASDELHSIRLGLKRLSGTVTSIFRQVISTSASQGFVSDNVSPVIHNGRLVLPVESMYKRQIKGIVHGESATGRTVYIEPAEVVATNNQLRELEAQEQREIIRLLAELTDTLRADSEIIKNNIELLVYLDFINVKARYARDINAVLPKIEKKPDMEWYHAVNPNLMASLKAHNREIVPLNITLSTKNRILVISGPNAGGKSVALKTVGLLQYMMQCGLLPPMYSNSHMGIFSHIFIDIGDNQSIDDDLSTYSSHIKNMRQLIARANPSTLFLIDEFGSGTEPNIGGAIAQAILLELNKNKAWGVITTHYQNLKQIAENTDGLINGSMLYDRQLMMPLFSLQIGSAGSSFALEIARKAGMPESIIKEATEIVGNDYIDADRYLLDINRDRKYWEQKRNDIKAKEKRLQQLIEQWETASRELKEKKNSIISEARKEAQSLLKDTNTNIEHAIKEIREAQAEKDKTKIIRGQLEEFKKKLEKEYTEELALKHPPLPAKEKKQKKKSIQSTTQKPHRDLAAGDIVKLDGKGISGEILEIQGNKAVVNFGLTKTSVDINRLTPSNEEKSQTVKISSTLTTDAAQSSKERRKNFRHEIDVRGMRVDEALQAVTYFIDDAIQFETSPIRILHGTGTGALRQAIRNHLATYGKRLSFRDEDVRLGGAGITVVAL